MRHGGEASPVSDVARGGDWRHYAGGYSPQALSGQARRIRRWLERDLDVYAYFNNDVGGHAPPHAADLRRFVARS